MTAGPLAAAVVFVDDVPRLTAFYQALAGMTLVQSDEQHAVLEAASFQLTIHAIGAAGHTLAAVYHVRGDSYVKFCLPVDSIARARASAAALGGEVWDPSKEWDATERGFRACDGHDLEGNVFQVREPL